MLLLCSLSIVATFEGNTQNPDTFLAFIDKSKSFATARQDSAIFYANKAYAIAVTQQDTVRIAQAVYHLSFHLLSANELEEAKVLLDFNLAQAKLLYHRLLGDTH